MTTSSGGSGDGGDGEGRKGLLRLGRVLLRGIMRKVVKTARLQSNNYSISLLATPDIHPLQCSSTATYATVLVDYQACSSLLSCLILTPDQDYCVSEKEG